MINILYKVMENKNLFNNLIAFADVFVGFFGKQLEIAVHDLRLEGNTLIHIAGNITGRTIGAPPTDFLLMQLATYGNKAPNLAPYPTKSPTGKPLKSSLMYIRDSKEEIIGALCINYDISLQLNVLHQLESQFKFTDLAINSEESKETFASTVEETGIALLDKLVNSLDKNPANLSREERIDFVSLCDKSGVFKLKGMLEEVAAIMNISKYTLYNYKKLSEHRK